MTDNNKEMSLDEKLQDLLKQATEERSHYYVASVLREVIADRKDLIHKLAQQDELLRACGVDTTKPIVIDKVVIKDENQRLRAALDRAKEALLSVKHTYLSDNKSRTLVKGKARDALYIIEAIEKGE